MPDQRFFRCAGPLRLDEIATLTGSEIAPGGDSARLFHDVAPLDAAGAEHLSFLDNRKYRDAFRASKAGACIIHPDIKDQAPAGMALLLNKRPYRAYALAAQAFYPAGAPPGRVAPSAVIGEGARIAPDAVIEAHAVIGPGAEIGPGTWIEAGSYIGPGVKIGAGCRVGPQATVTHSLVGDHVRIYPGCRIGQDGFGFAPDPAGHVKVPQLGRVVIGDGVEIGANTTIDRGSGPDTEIGAGTWIDNLVQIGHNVKIGKGCIIVAQAGVSGSTSIGDYAVLAGQAGVAGHLKIGAGARIAAQSGVLRDVPAGEEQMGYPALPLRQFMRQIATLKKLTKKQ
jgi:UDP-3-O-[3-hydroxymyristoyl] glucosamine N-acyltransferase